MKLQPKTTGPKRITRNKISVSTDEERVEPVYALPHTKTAQAEAELKNKFEEISNRHKETLTSIALTYLSLVSAVEHVSELVRDVAVSDFSLNEPEYKSMVEEKLDAAISYFVSRECFTAVNATEEDMATLLTKPPLPKSVGTIGAMHPRQHPTSNTVQDPMNAIGVFLNEMRDKLTVQPKTDKPFGEIRRTRRK